MTPPIEGATGGNQKIKPCPFCGTDKFEAFAIFDKGAVYQHPKDLDCPVSRSLFQPQFWNRRADTQVSLAGNSDTETPKSITKPAPTPAHPVADDLEKEAHDFAVGIWGGTITCKDLTKKLVAFAQRQRESGWKGGHENGYVEGKKVALSDTQKKVVELIKERDHRQKLNEQYAGEVGRLLNKIGEMGKEVAALKSLIGKERDEFGAKETRLMVEVAALRELLGKAEAAIQRHHPGDHHPCWDGHRCETYDVLAEIKTHLDKSKGTSEQGRGKA